MQHEVNLADFIAMEACRLFLPDVYSRIRLNKDKFSGHVGYSESRSAYAHPKWPARRTKMAGCAHENGRARAFNVAGKQGS
jgi:hypothetical protein